MIPIGSYRSRAYYHIITTYVDKSVASKQSKWAFEGRFAYPFPCASLTYPLPSTEAMTHAEKGDELTMAKRVNDSPSSLGAVRAINNMMKHQSKSSHAKNQQIRTRKETLSKKLFEYNLECDADVYLILRTRKSGQTYTVTSGSTEQLEYSSIEIRNC